LDCMVTSNPVHLLVSGGQDQEAIPRSIYLMAGRTSQEYNQRKN
jgi:putative transposase